MKIALIGGTGFVGSAILGEALERGHHVTALARNASKYTLHERLTVVNADVRDAAQVARAAAGHDAVINAYNPRGAADVYEEFLKGTRAIYDGVRASGVKRLLVVGGAGSLFVAPGVQLVDTPDFPAEWKSVAQAAREALRLIQQETALDWTFLSPAPFLDPGPRTAKFRLGRDEPLKQADGTLARVSVADLAVAALDEIEQPRHVRQRFTLGY